MYIYVIYILYISHVYTNTYTHIYVFSLNLIQFKYNCSSVLSKDDQSYLSLSNNNSFSYLKDTYLHEFSTNNLFRGSDFQY